MIYLYSKGYVHIFQNVINAEFRTKALPTIATKVKSQL